MDDPESASTDIMPPGPTLLQKITAEKDVEAVQDRLREIVTKVLKPYLDGQKEGFERISKLLSVASSLCSPFAALSGEQSQQLVVDDILRAAVVLLHACLEDFLRTMARELLPEGDGECLREIPLVGNRETKFSLGCLVRHKGKLVDDVLRESVSEHLDRESFNNKGDIESLMKRLGFNSSAVQNDLVSIQEMILRRHQIVHRADRIRTHNSKTHQLQPISYSEVSQWLNATRRFMFNLTFPLLDKILPLEAAKLRLPDTPTKE